jgi:predicted ATPase
MITRIETDGYRLLDGFAADFRPLTVVIGANAVGKSTLIDCLQLIAQCAEVPMNTAIGWHWGPASMLTAGKRDGKLGWRVTLQKPDTAYWNRVPLQEGNPLIYEVQLQTDPQGQVRPQYEVLRNPKPKPGYAEPLKFLEATPFRRMILDRSCHLVPFDQAQPETSAVQESATSALVAVPDGMGQPSGQEPALLLSQLRFFNEFPVPSATRLLLANMVFYPGFDVTRLSALRTKAAEIKPMPTLALNGENLGTVLHDLLTRYDFRSVADELRDFLRVAYPAFEEIHCDTTFGTPPQVLVRVRERGMPRSTELWELSDGMLRFLCLATALLNPAAPPLIAVDEPELGLHPRLLPIVGDLIKSAAERTQVLVTTHSPDLLNRFGLEDIAVMARAPDAPRAVWHRPADRKTLVRMLEEVSGETLGDLHRSGELEAGA